jgi:PAS domain S-box-containing protein
MELRGLNSEHQCSAARDRLWTLSDELLLAIDRRGRLLCTSPSVSRCTALSEEALRGRAVVDFLHPADLDEVAATLRGLRRSDTRARFEARLRSANGSWLPIRWTITPDRGAGRFDVVGRDVTVERETREALRRAEEQARQSQKMEILGQLAGGIAHDVNNLLTAVLGNLDLLERRVADERLKTLVRAAARAAGRGTRLAEQLLAFARQQRIAGQTHDLNVVIEELAQLLRRAAGSSVDVQARLARELWQTCFDRTQFEVALLNLALNARDAMPKGGELKIETRNVASDAADRPGDLCARDYIAVSVADNGQGMRGDVLARALTPFFTTKEHEKGTGLGLPQVDRFAREFQGTVRILSRIGEGTKVEIYLPRST